MNYFMSALIHLISPYVHIVCATLLVGGTLFYEMVVPIAIGDLRPEQQMSVFARARWMFKGIVWLSVVLMLVTGVVQTYAHWAVYTQQQYYFPHSAMHMRSSMQPGEIVAAGRAGWWWAAHVSTGVIALFIALGLNTGKTPPNQPIRWMRLNLAILLLVMFFASAARYARYDAIKHHWSVEINSPTAQP